jgi:hypothetical protein
MGWNVLAQQSTPIRYRLVTLLVYTLIAYTFVACSSANRPPAGSPPKADLTRADWNNFTYSGLCNPDQGDHVAVKNGTAIDSGSWGKSLVQVYRPVFGDLTGDGQPEAVVPYGCSDTDPNSPIQGTVYVHVIIFSGNPAQPMVIGQFPPWPGNSNNLRTIRTVDFVKIDHGMLQLIGGGFSGEGPASLDLQITNKYRWTGSHFEPVSSQTESFTSNPRPGSNGQQLEFVCSRMVAMNVKGTNQSGQYAEWGWHQVATVGLTWGWVGSMRIQWKDQAGTMHEYDQVSVPRLYSMYIYHAVCA